MLEQVHKLLLEYKKVYKDQEEKKKQDRSGIEDKVISILKSICFEDIHNQERVLIVEESRASAQKP